MAAEVIIIGGGPAGLSAGIGLHRFGLAVKVLEQRTEWQGRVCGGFINPEGITHLRWLGALDRLQAAGAVPVDRSVLSLPDGRTGTVPIGRRGVAGLGVSRQVLEAILLDAALDAGCEVTLGARAVDVCRDGDRWQVAVRLRGLREDTVGADLVVLADGRFSRAARRPPVRRRGWFGWNATFAGVSQTPGQLSMHFYPRGYVGVLTFADGETNVCGLTWLEEGQSRRWETVWAEAADRQPSLRRLAKTAQRVSEWRGVGPLPFTRAMRRSDGPLLAGDAAAVGDPYMGEGISRALGTGPIVHRALAEVGGERLDAGVVGRSYSRLWRQHYTSRLRLGALVRTLQERPALFHAGLGLLLGQPESLHALSRVFHPVSASRD
jgi:2-polyprenyl-6-methoxyphenol hydroxylase-like FAD-dependent oxidoreductase